MSDYVRELVAEARRFQSSKTWPYQIDLVRRLADALEGRSSGEVTDAEVEAAARAMFEDPLTPGDGYTWAEMVAEDRSRADMWRTDARRVLGAAREARS